MGVPKIGARLGRYIKDTLTLMTVFCMGCKSGFIPKMSFSRYVSVVDVENSSGNLRRSTWTLGCHNPFEILPIHLEGGRGLDWCDTTFASIQNIVNLNRISDRFFILFFVLFLISRYMNYKLLDLPC